MTSLIYGEFGRANALIAALRVKLEMAEGFWQILYSNSLVDVNDDVLNKHAEKRVARLKNCSVVAVIPCGL